MRPKKGGMLCRKRDTKSATSKNSKTSLRARRPEEKKRKSEGIRYPTEKEIGRGRAIGLKRIVTAIATTFRASGYLD